jgi:hypothetical protein
MSYLRYFIIGVVILPDIGSAAAVVNPTANMSRMTTSGTVHLKRRWASLGTPKM